MSENQNSEFCGDDLEDMEQLYDAKFCNCSNAYKTTQEKTTFCFCNFSTIFFGQINPVNFENPGVGSSLDMDGI